MIQWIIHQIKYFLDQFWRTPSGGGGGEPLCLEKIIRYECTHFLFSLFLGWVVFSLTLTILSSPRFKEYDHYMWNISFVSGFLVSVTTHMLIDAYTTLA